MISNVTVFLVTLFFFRLGAELIAPVSCPRLRSTSATVDVAPFLPSKTDDNEKLIFWPESLQTFFGGYLLKDSG